VSPTFDSSLVAVMGILETVKVQSDIAAWTPFGGVRQGSALPSIKQDVDILLSSESKSQALETFEDSIPEASKPKLKRNPGAGPGRRYEPHFQASEARLRLSRFKGIVSDLISSVSANKEVVSSVPASEKSGIEVQTKEEWRTRSISILVYWQDIVRILGFEGKGYTGIVGHSGGIWSIYRGG